MQTKDFAREGISTVSLYFFITVLLGYLTITTAVFLYRSGQAALMSWILAIGSVHLGLYWLNSRIPKSPRWWIFYYAAQALLITAIALITRGEQDINISLFESAIICIVGETLGWWGNSTRALSIGGGFALLAFGLIFLLNETEAVIPSLSGLLINGGGIILIMILFNQQLHEREKAQELAESLESANARLAASAAKIKSLTLQNERQRMARELHDTLAQGVAGLVLQLEAEKAHLAAERTERAAAIIEQALARARSTLAESRAAIDDLRAAPTNLHEAVRETTERFIQATGIPVELDFFIEEGDERRLSPEIADHALHILSEALTNTARHAGATQVQVKWNFQNHCLELEVRDNGKGFDVTRQTSGHYGLVGMRERARLTGGVLAIESNENGTSVQFNIGRAG